MEIDFQYGDYKGTFQTKLGGNCLGGSILQSVLSSIEDDNFTDGEGREYVSEFTLTNQSGDELTIFMDDEALDNVVAVRIIHWEEETK